MGRWSPPRGRCSRARSDRRDRANRRCGGRGAVGVPPRMPPLPRRIQTTGVWWAAAAVVLITLAKITFGPARGSLGVVVTVWDDAVGWLAGLRASGPDRAHGGDRCLHRIGLQVEALRWGPWSRYAAGVPPPDRVHRLLLGRAAGGPAGDGGPPTPWVELRGSWAVSDAVAAGRHPGRDPGRHALHPGPGVAAGDSSANGSPPAWWRCSRWPGSTWAWTLPPTRSGRRDRRGRVGEAALPAVRSQRGLPGRLQAYAAPTWT